MLKIIRYVLNFEWLAGLSMSEAKNVFLGLYVLIGVLVLLVPNDSIYQDAKKCRWWYNLKLWALGDLAFIFITYYIF